MDGFEKLIALFLLLLLVGTVHDLRVAVDRIADAAECAEVIE